MAEVELREQMEAAMRRDDFEIHTMADAAWSVISPVVAERDALKAELDEARAERNDLRARHTGALIHAHRLTGRIAIGTELWTVLEALVAALDAPQRPEDTREETGS